MEQSTVYAELDNRHLETPERRVGDACQGDERNRRCLPQKLRWSTIGTVHGKNLNIPESPGVYGYAEVTRVQGLPVSVRWIYIGKATNLRRRISNGHDYRYEKNPRLRAWIGRNPRNAELWFACVEASDVDGVERSLIADIQPEFNINLK